MKKRAQKRDPLSSKKNRETAATKKNPERFNARGFVSCASTRFSELGGGFGVGECGCRPARPSNLPFTYTLDELQLDPTLSRRATWLTATELQTRMLQPRRKCSSTKRGLLTSSGRSLEHSTCLLSPARCEGG
jgi:hypothetical protein